jgi:hypothetical protein
MHPLEKDSLLQFYDVRMEMTFWLPQAEATLVQMES